MQCCLLSVLLCLHACLQGWVHLLHLLLARIALALLLLLAEVSWSLLQASRRRHLLLALVPVQGRGVATDGQVGGTASAGIQTQAGRLSADRANRRMLLATM
jgi:hypothetical protein